MALDQWDEQVLQIALPLIKRFEGCSLKPYLDQAGIPTIGYGCIQYPDGKPVTVHDGEISQEAADHLLEIELRKKLQALIPMLKRPASPNQGAAMLSLTYNIGTGHFRTSMVLREFNLGNFQKASEAFLMWDKITVDGQKVASLGLEARRACESILFLKG